MQTYSNAKEGEIDPAVFLEAMKKCQTVGSGTYDTAGQEIKVLVCRCEQTACSEQKYYELPKDFMRLSQFKVNVEKEHLRSDGCQDCELTMEEEKAFYKGLFHSAK